MVQYLTLSTFSGNSLATWDLCRRRMKGLMMRFNFLVFSVSDFFSMGMRNSFVKNDWDLSRPGLIKLICDQRSMVVFSSGVPVRIRRFLDLRVLTALEILEFGFFMAWDSSRMI